MKPVPRVSIGLPVYNGERFLAEAIESMLAQTYTDFELIISDNGSTDGTPAICRGFVERDGRVSYHRSDVNRGSAWNWNRVVELSRGTYFKWLAHDDVYAPTYLEQCVAVLDSDPGVAWCHSRTALIDDRGDPIPEATGPEREADRLRELNQAKTAVTLAEAAQPHRRFGAALERSLLSDILATTRREALVQTGLHPPYYGGDKVMIASLSLQGRYHEIPESLIYMRRHASQGQWLPSRRRHHEFITGRKAGWFVWPRQVRCTAAYFNLARTAPVSWGEKLRCFKEVLGFVFQGKKWKRLIVDAVRSFGVKVRVPEDDINPAARRQAAAVRGEKSATSNT
ncbi:MAG: glycosyltransferase [Planctomycetia bacterium]|nr:glycosyltransferase [Planctomycetia bacterium]